MERKTILFLIYSLLTIIIDSAMSIGFLKYNNNNNKQSETTSLKSTKLEPVDLTENYTFKSNSKLN